jgi:hypothetical protein
MSEPKLVHRARSPMLSLAIAFALNPLAVNAEVLSITPIGADAYSHGFQESGYELIQVTRNTSTVLAEGGAQWISADIGTGAIKYVTHVNTTPSGVPVLESTGRISTSAAGGLAYQFSNLGSTTLTLPAGSMQLTLSSQSGSRRLPSTLALNATGDILAFHAEGMLFGFGEEIANAGFSDHVNHLIATQTPNTLTLVASGAMNELARYSSAQQAWTQDESFIVDDASQGHVGVELKPGEIRMGEVTSSAIDHTVSLSMTLSNALDITIAPGTSRIFEAEVSSWLYIQPSGEATEANFPHLFKDASHSANLALKLPIGISVVGDQPSWVTAVPEAGTLPMALAGVLGVLGVLGVRAPRRGRQRHRTPV